MSTLYLITARGGSKGLPGKNIKQLAGKPLINYSIDIARQFVLDADICVSTDDEEIAKTVQDYGLEIPFMRPSALATDHANHHEVILHAIEFYKQQGIIYDNILLLQPTSPFRKEKHIEDVISLYNNDLDMIVSVKPSKANPYFNLFEEDKQGYLVKSVESSSTRRQDASTVYQMNGSIYLINVESILKKPLNELKKIKKYVMDDYYSIDIDNNFDFTLCEFLIENRMIK